MDSIENVIIVNDFDYVQGGASKVAIDTANILKKMNPQLNVYFFSGVHSDDSTLDRSIIKVCTNQGEALKSKNKIKGVLSNIYNFKSKKQLKILLKKLNNNETIIHIHGWTKSLSSSIFSIIYKMNFKMVLTLHDYFTACPNGGYFNYKKNEICLYMPLSFKCIKCNCDSRNYGYKIYRIVRQFVQNKIVKLPKKIGNVITISDFSEEILKKTLYNKIFIYRVDNPIDLDENPIYVDHTKNQYYLYVGRISKEKGVDIFCKAISNLNLKGVVVGDGDQKHFLEKEYPNINFVGWKNSQEVKEYMKKAKALIFPSRWYEGAPLTPLEAMQYGIPLITSDCNAAVDYVKNSENGISYHTYEELCDVLKSEKKFSPKIRLENNYADEIVKVYDSIMKKNTNGGKSDVR